MDKLLKDITILQEPYSHLVIAEQERFKNIYKKFTEICFDKEIFCSMIEGKNCKKLKSLFEEFMVKLQFPNYFGENWAAFDECLNDLEWLEAEKYVLFINDIDKLLIKDRQEFKTFINILISAIDEWASGRNYDSFPTPPTPFHLVLHCNKNNAELVESRLSEVGISKLDKIIL